MCEIYNSNPVLRLGKPVENLQAALKAALVSGPAGEQITAIAKQIAYFAFLTCDGLTWVRAPSKALTTLTFSSEQRYRFLLLFVGDDCQTHQAYLPLLAGRNHTQYR